MLYILYNVYTVYILYVQVHLSSRGFGGRSFIIADRVKTTMTTRYYNIITASGIYLPIPPPTARPLKSPLLYIYIYICSFSPLLQCSYTSRTWYYKHSRGIPCIMRVYSLYIYVLHKYLNASLSGFIGICLRIRHATQKVFSSGVQNTYHIIE